MNMPGKHPYKRRIPRHQRKRRSKHTSEQNPYIFNPKTPSVTPADTHVIPASAGTKPKNPNRSVAARKPKPPKDDQINNQRLFRDKPSRFAERILNVQPWQKQREILNALANHRNVAVRSCNGAGKTFTAAVAVLWWLMSYDNAIVITTAPSERQVKELLWREIRRLYMPHRDVIGGKLTRTRLDFGPDRYAYGFSTNTEDRFQGFHSGNILVVVDEASGVDEFIYYAINGILTTQNAKLLMIGNPHGLAGTFYDAFRKNRKGYKTIHISAFDTPAFKQAGVTAKNIQDLEFPDPDEENDTPVIPADAGTQRKAKHTDPNAHAGTQRKAKHATSHIPIGLSAPRWALHMFNSYGPRSSVYQTRVLGEFPEQSEDALIPLYDVEAAVKRQTEHQPDEKPVMGVNIARFGDDKTVIIIRKGQRVFYFEEIRRSNLARTISSVITAAQKYDVRDFFVDTVGDGAGVLKDLKRESMYNAKDLRGGYHADEPQKYIDMRAQIFDKLRKRFADGEISIPDDPELISQLASLTFRYNAKGQLEVESKPEIRSQGRQSPDKADALAFAFHEPYIPKQIGSRAYSPENIRRLRRNQRWARLWRDRRWLD